MTRGYAAIGLYQPKCDANVGGVMRAAMCFGASMIAVQSTRLRDHGTNVLASHRHIPVIRTDDLLAVRPIDCQMVAVEFIDGAQELHTFKHPPSAFYVFGPEDGNVPTHILERAQHVIRLRSRFCLNLAATVNVVLHDRVSKQPLESREAA